jgi:hypothetical protein
MERSVGPEGSAHPSRPKLQARVMEQAEIESRVQQQGFSVLAGETPREAHTPQIQGGMPCEGGGGGEIALARR